jgi:hypothetical protein
VFDQIYPCYVKSIGCNVKEVNKAIHRFCGVALLFDFTPAFAAGVADGDTDGQLHDKLCVGPLKKATLDINEGVSFQLNPGEPDQLEMLGVVESMQLSAPSKPELEPTAKLMINFATDDDRVLWFVHRLDEEISIMIQSRQTELDL